MACCHPGSHSQGRSRGQRATPEGALPVWRPPSWPHHCCSRVTMCSTTYILPTRTAEGAIVTPHLLLFSNGLYSLYITTAKLAQMFGINMTAVEYTKNLPYTENIVASFQVCWMNDWINEWITMCDWSLALAPAAQYCTSQMYRYRSINVITISVL